MWRDERHESENRSRRLHEDITRQLEVREERIENIQEQIQVVTQDFADKFHNLAAPVDRAEKGTGDIVFETTENLKKLLDEIRRGESEASANNIRQLHAIKENLEKELSVAKSRLAEYAKLEANDTVLQASLVVEKKTSKQLSYRVEQLEKDALLSDQLRRKWEQDMAALTNIRRRLKQVDSRLPENVDFDKKLTALLKNSKMLQGTEAYLAGEHQWVQNELKKRRASNDIATKLSNIEGFRSSAVQNSALSDLSFPSGKVFQRQPNSKISEEIKNPEQSQKEHVQHRVTLKSPELDSAKHVSVADEQVNRRMAIRPKSILKHGNQFLTKSSIKLFQKAHLESSHQPIASSRNIQSSLRPIGKSGLTATSNMTAEQIRSGLTTGSEDELN